MYDAQQAGWYAIALLA